MFVDGVPPRPSLLSFFLLRVEADGCYLCILVPGRSAQAVAAKGGAACFSLDFVWRVTKATRLHPHDTHDTWRYSREGVRFCLDIPCPYTRGSGY